MRRRWPLSNALRGDISATCDPKLRQHPENFETHVKNIYRTLLTRGMKGCYVYFVDKPTEEFFGVAWRVIDRSSASHRYATVELHLNEPERP